MLLKIAPGPLDLVPDKAGDRRHVFGHVPVHGHQKLPEQVRQHLLIAPRAVHKLIPHPAKQLLVLPGQPRVKDIAVRRDAVVLQDVADFAPREVDEPHLRPISAKIVIILHLFGLIQDHVAGRNDDFLPVQHKMSLPRRYINDLPVHPALRPQSRKLGPRVQLIVSRAQDSQGPPLFPEGHSGAKQIAGIDIQIFSRYSFLVVFCHICLSH